MDKGKLYLTQLTFSACFMLMNDLVEKDKLLIQAKGDNSWSLLSLTGKESSAHMKELV